MANWFDMFFGDPLVRRGVEIQQIEAQRKRERQYRHLLAPTLYGKWGFYVATNEREPFNFHAFGESYRKVSTYDSLDAALADLKHLGLTKEDFIQASWGFDREEF